jgi:3-dehydroquinate dehydratase II
MAKILVVNGPNLNLLGTREPELYGHETLDAILARLQSLAQAQGVAFSALQSNAEHELIERIHAARDDGTSGIVINPGAFGHTSIALRDALIGSGLPFVEVHLSNVYAREPFRHHSYLSDRAAGVIVGLGPLGYELGLTALLRRVHGS